MLYWNQIISVSENTFDMDNLLRVWKSGADSPDTIRRSASEQYEAKQREAGLRSNLDTALPLNTWNKV